MSRNFSSRTSTLGWEKGFGIGLVSDTERMVEILIFPRDLTTDPALHINTRPTSLPCSRLPSHATDSTLSSLSGAFPPSPIIIVLTAAVVIIFCDELAESGLSDDSHGRRLQHRPVPCFFLAQTPLTSRRASSPRASSAILLTFRKEMRRRRRRRRRRCDLPTT
ncbi:hypothetical protein EUGRSUZ_J03062 [Eucalyptus grandis]|uniref:Uncharacterized protein n=2 Tax=Eucalyptus grandis TaxID=71139 RepID=A0ACC3JAH9_EUCGR|nr:hypothetical protein EUGRSUZ_J03062 [Eucalyptus grandis]